MGPKSVLDAVSLPVKKTPSAPITAEKKGKNPPAFAMSRARVDVIPEKFMTAAIPTMNATIDAKSTRLPAAARKSQVKVTGYGVDLVTIVGSWEIRALGLAEVPL